MKDLQTLALAIELMNKFGLTADEAAELAVDIDGEAERLMEARTEAA